MPPKDLPCGPQLQYGRGERKLEHWAGRRRAKPAVQDRSCYGGARGFPLDQMSTRIAVIGPRRARTGTGPYVARFLREYGFEVLEWGRQQAQAFLSSPCALPPVEAIAICSPPETHFAFLAAALRRSLGVLCEKPLVWPPDHSAASLRRLTAQLDAAARGGPKPLLIHENTQWPYTLPGYRELAGDFTPDQVREFECIFAPSRGDPPGMIMEAAPHANSLLLALGCTGTGNLSLDYRPPGEDSPARIEIRFESRGPGGAVQVCYRFEQCPQQPRPAAYAVNGKWAWRRVALPGYGVYLKLNGKELEIQDPMRLCVGDFAWKISEGAPAAGETALPAAIRRNLEMSAAILEGLELLEASGEPHA